ncbi:MAG: alpha/beta fold hydrolase [Actinomycetota bacterium]
MELNVVVTEAAGQAHPTPVVFVHGAWNGAWCWTEHFTQAFADAGFTSYAIDLRGHGASEGSVRTSRISHYVHDVRRLVLELDTDPVIVGHSMGGLITQHYLSQYRAAGGVLMASVPTTGAIGATVRFASSYPGAFVRVNATFSLWPVVDDPERAASLMFGPTMPHTEAVEYAKRLQNESYPAYLEMIADLPRASRVTDPMLVLGGQHDWLFSPSEVRATARAYGTEAKIFGGMGHHMPLDRGWRGPADTIIEWIGQLPATRQTPQGTDD